MNFSVAILAAGASARMGQPKLLLPWRGTTMLGHLTSAWRALGAAQLAILTVPAPDPLAAELARLAPLDRIVNPAPRDGMFSSIRSAARWRGWLPASTHILLTLGDQPHVQPGTLRALIDFAARHPKKICQPSRAGRPRHPVILPREIFVTLADTPADTLKQFLHARPALRATCESPDPALDFDIDEPADYDRALRMFGKPIE